MAEIRNYDVVIVGGGTAGCIVAAKLSEKGIDPSTGAKLKIAMIEAGAYLKGDPRPGYGIPLRRQSYTNIPRDIKFGRNYVTPQGRGRGVGGSSLVFGSGAWTPFDEDYDEWQEETGVDWTKENFKPAVDEALRVFNVHLQPPATFSNRRSTELFRKTAEGMGYELRPGHGRAVKNCIFCGHCADRQLCKYDSKQGTLVTHAPIADRNGVDIIANARAKRIIIERSGGRAVARGVVIKKLDLPDHIYPGDEFADWDSAREITVLAKKVIVSCGDLETPPLLFASGYGSKEDCGDRLIVENPNVGRNIDGHYGEGGQVGVVGLFDERVSGQDGGWGVDEFLHFQTKVGDDRIVLLNGYGAPPFYGFFHGIPERIALSPFAPPAGQVFADAIPLLPPFGQAHKDFMRGICNPWVEPTEASMRAREPMLRAARIAVDTKLPRRAPRGRITSESSVQIFGPEIVAYSRETGKEERIYRSIHPEVHKTFAAGQEIAKKILEKMGAKKIIAEPIIPRGGLTFKWLVGGVRAGVDPKNSVINQNFESHDIDNLMIVDAGSIPRSPTLGLFLTVGITAIFASDRIVARHFTRRRQ
ncbi:MAG: GMC family oxidoreductase [Acidobacteria bacterium]|nr:GMC family oxidoreductase [Acidobacteriota bacterium]MCW5970069.1 GMC family oxidoreductase [Blastocatellales bacterium]